MNENEAVKPSLTRFEGFIIIVLFCAALLVPETAKEDLYAVFQSKTETAHSEEAVPPYLLQIIDRVYTDGPKGSAKVKAVVVWNEGKIELVNVKDGDVPSTVKYLLKDVDAGSGQLKYTPYAPDSE